MTASSVSPAQTPQVVEQPPPKIVSADEILTHLVVQVPELSDVSAQLRLMLGVYVEFIETPTPPPADQIVPLLEALFNTDMPGFRGAALAVNKVVTTAKIVTAKGWEEKTGSVVNPDTLDIDSRYRDEIDEQNLLNDLALDYLAKLSSIFNLLGIPDLYTQEQQAQDVGAKAPQQKLSFTQGLSRNFAQAAVRMGFAHVQEELPAEGEEEKAHVVASWQTPPILSPDNKQYLDLTKRLNGVLALMNWFAKDPNMKSIVLGKLSNTPTTPAVLAQLCRAISEMCHRQLAQSAEAKQTVTTDRAAFIERVKSLKYVMGVYAAVLHVTASAR